MRTFVYAAASAVLFTASAFVMVTVPTWKISDKYSVKFSAGEADGIFKGLKGTIKFDEADLAGSSVNVSIDANTINTGNAMMNKHAKGKEWLDAAAHPTITFVSSSFAKTAKGYEAKGKLTIKGTTKEVSLPFTFTPSGSKAVFKSNFSVVRKDYKITNEGIDETIKIDLNVPVTK